MTRRTVAILEEGETYEPDEEDEYEGVEFAEEESTKAVNIVLHRDLLTTPDEEQRGCGNVQPYKFIIPPTWKRTRVANILSGNYCQPKCAEPWVEVKFENGKQRKIQVVASPLIRLTNKPNATIEEISDPEKLIASLGPFVTGNTYDPDELIEATTEKYGDLTYYKYVLDTPFAVTGSHNLAKATAKGNTVVLFVVSANDKQWQTSEKILKAMLDSFQV
ncbi:hypothetical protein QQ045_019939 [Rhodiola kirilowii]